MMVFFFHQIGQFLNSSLVLQIYLLWTMAMHFDDALNIGPNHRTLEKNNSWHLDIFFQVRNFCKLRCTRKNGSF